jgi:hypothetical protein
MHEDWPEMARELSTAIKEVRLGTPEAMKSFVRGEHVGTRPEPG